MLTGIDPTGAEILDKFEELKATFPGADICEDIEMLKPYADMLVDFLADRIDTFNPPLDIIQGTTFQREVWAELRKVKPGETATYSEIAERIGKPKAYRAVANACANNNCAIAIPCHRIIRSDGTISGYRWGIEWKEKLLQIEAQKGKEQYATL